MKKIISYLYILLPLMLLSIYQNSSWFSKQQIVVEPATAIQANETIYTLKPGSNQQLKAIHLKNEIAIIATTQQAINFLEKYLTLSKNHASNVYAGYAISGFQQMKSSHQSDGAVLLKYVEILEFSHQFEKALGLLATASKQAGYADTARLRMINIHMIKGNLNKAAIICDEIKKGTLWTVAAICKHWLDGMNNNNPQSISGLNSIVNFLYNDSELRLWIYQLLIDLYLNNDRVEQAIFTLSKIYSEQAIDPAPLMQIVDYLILKKRAKQADDLIKKYDSLNNLKIRRVITNKINFEDANLFAEAQNQIQLYKDINDHSKYREIALWEMLVGNNHKAAIHYAELNYQLYKTQNDQLLYALANQYEFQW